MNGTPRPGRVVALAALLVVALGAAPGVRAADVVVRRAVVPEPERPHGEVRLVLRGDDIIVQTLLHTRVVRRAAGAIADKERSNWPADVPGHDDAERFVETLAFVAAAARAAEVEGADRRRGLCVELSATGVVTVGGARIAAEPDGLRLLEVVEPRVALELSSGYVDRNRRLILADAFGVDEATASHWIAEAGKPVARP